MQAAEPAIQKKGDTAVRAGVAGAPTIKDAPTGCSNAVCGIIVEIKSTGTGKKATHSLTVDVGESTPIKVVSTVAMDAGTRIVVALAGSSIGDAEISEPVICDAHMLGWADKLAGPVQLPKSFEAGDSAPEERPKAAKAAAQVDKLGNVEAEAGVEALFISKPKLSKEEKEIAKLEKLVAKGDAKAVTKLQHLKLKQSIAARRAAGEEVFTDDEMEAVGLT